MPRAMRSRWIVLSSTALGIAVAIALIFRPSRSIQPELPAPAHIPERTRARLAERMERHVARMGDLMSRLVVLDYDGAARAAGAIYDEPPIAGQGQADELARALPPRFRILEEELRSEAKGIVSAAAAKDSAALAERFATITKTCVLCHATYLYDHPTP